MKKYYLHFLMEGLGLFIFMVSACFFGGYLEHPGTWLNTSVTNPHTRLIIMALAMAATALFIFLSPLTSPSGAFINPSVTLMRWRLGQLSLERTIWYSLFQTLGGILAVVLMKVLMGKILSEPPVNFVVTVPGKGITVAEAAFMEFISAFIMIAMVLFISDTKLKKAVPYFSAVLVCCYVYFAGPVSGFGMNPARTLASAIPANIYTDLWIYMFLPTLGMLAAAELYLVIKKKKPVVDFSVNDDNF